MKLFAVMGQETFGVEGRHATGACRSNRLAIVVVGNVTGRKDPFHTRLSTKRLDPLDVAFFV